MEEALMNTGTILVKTINKLSTNRVIIQDIDYLETMLDGAMSAPEVVYAIARDQEGRILVGKSKGILQKGSQGIRDPELLLFPDDALTTTFFSQQHRTPLHPTLDFSLAYRPPEDWERSSHKQMERPAEELRKRVPETLYDFALPRFIDKSDDQRP